jgi:hypothetical protein
MLSLCTLAVFYVDILSFTGGTKVLLILPWLRCPILFATFVHLFTYIVNNILVTYIDISLL